MKQESKHSKIPALAKLDHKGACIVHQHHGQGQQIFSMHQQQSTVSYFKVALCH